MWLCSVLCYAWYACRQLHVTSAVPADLLSSPTCCCAQQSYLLFCSAVLPDVSLSSRTSAIAGFSGMPAPPVRIPSKPPSIQQAPTGGAPMGTPPSARGIAAQLPFVDGSPEGRPSNFFCPSLSLLHAGTAFSLLASRVRCLSAAQHQLAVKQRWLSLPFLAKHGWAELVHKVSVYNSTAIWLRSCLVHAVTESLSTTTP